MSKQRPPILKVFFDTEFTDFIDGRLISIGLVAEDGREFYAELTDTWQPSDCSTFVLDTVLPLLSTGDQALNEIELVRATEAQVALRLKEWIEALGRESKLYSDAPSYDWHWVVDLFKDHDLWPRNLATVCAAIDFGTPEQNEASNRAIEDYWAEHGINRHHALVDARSLQMAWRAMQELA